MLEFSEPPVETLVYMLSLEPVPIPVSGLMEPQTAVQ
jgi:hypothetical protein